MHISYHVAPRYTAGSPASVSEEIALQVAGEEIGAYGRAISGRYGEEMQKQAQALGLRGIVEEVHVYANYNEYLDLLTGEKRDTKKASKKHMTAAETDLSRMVKHLVDDYESNGILRSSSIAAAKDLLNRLGV